VALESYSVCNAVVFGQWVSRMHDQGVLCLELPLVMGVSEEFSLLQQSWVGDSVLIGGE